MSQTLPTPEAVQELLSVVFTETQLENAISDASLVLGDACGNGYVDPRYTAIVRYLAAHLLASTQQGVAGSLSSESVDGTSYSLNTASLGQGLEGTSYGQQALLLDVNGCLTNRGKTQVKMKLL